MINFFITIAIFVIENFSIKLYTTVWSFMCPKCVIQNPIGASSRLFPKRKKGKEKEKLPICINLTAVVRPLYDGWITPQSCRSSTTVLPLIEQTNPTFKLSLQWLSACLGLLMDLWLTASTTSQPIRLMLNNTN